MPTVPPVFIIDALVGYVGNMLNVERPAGTLKFAVNETGLVYSTNAVFGLLSVWSAGLVVGEQGLVVGAGGAATTQIMADGQVRAKTGTAANPSYAFLADTASGLRSGGTGVLHLVTSGGDKVTIDASGNVGIGTGGAAPAARLEVAGSVKANVTDPLAYQFLNAGKTAGIVIDTQNGAVRPVTDDVYTLGAGAQRWRAIHVGTDASSFAGNVGIGQGKRLQLNLPEVSKYIWQSDANAAPGDPEGLDGRIGFSTNVFIRGSGDMTANPPQLWIGPHANDFLYIVNQETAFQSGKWQMALTTVRRPDGNARVKPITWGYGFHPLRVWGKGFLSDLGGQLVLTGDEAAGVFMPGIYFQKTKHLDLADGAAYFPDHYTGGRPYKDAGETVELGGVQRANGAANEAGVRIWRSASGSGTNWTLGNDLNFQDVTNGAMKLADFVRSNTPKLKVAMGETTTLVFNDIPPKEREKDFGTFSLPSGYFSSTPKVILTAENVQNAWGVSLQAYNVNSVNFGIMGRQNWDAAGYPVQFTVQWIAVGT